MSNSLSQQTEAVLLTFWDLADHLWRGDITLHSDSSIVGISELYAEAS